MSFFEWLINLFGIPCDDPAVRTWKKLGAAVKMNDAGEVIEITLQGEKIGGQIKHRHVSSDDISLLAQMVNLKVLDLAGTDMNGEKLVHLRNLKNLEDLILN